MAVESVLIVVFVATTEASATGAEADGSAVSAVAELLEGLSDVDSAESELDGCDAASEVAAGVSEFCPLVTDCSVFPVAGCETTVSRLVVAACELLCVDEVD